MKRILLTALIALVAGFASAQTEKGGWMVGASVANLNYGLTDKDFSLDLTPQAGYFISDNVALGGQLLLSVYSPKDGESLTSWGIAPFVRGYFGGTEKGKFFGQGNVGVAGSSFDDETTTAFALGATAGYAYFITRNVSLETGLGYSYSKAKDFDGSSNLGLNFGFQIYLGGKK